MKKTNDILYLSRDDVISTQVSMAEIIRALEAVFVEKGNGRVEMPPKPGIHPLPDAFIHAMPAYVPSMRVAGLKWVSGFPQNMAKQLPYISGLLILNDVMTGLPLSIMDCTWITGMRTGAATAVAAKYLARPNSLTVAILGCGIQGRCNLEALKVAFPGLTRVQAYDLNPSASEYLCKEAHQKWRLDACSCQSAKEACTSADIIVTAGPILKNPSPVIEQSWLKKGVFLSLVDFDSYLKPEVFSAANLFYTDDIEQQQYYRKAGYFSKIPQPHGDLGDLLVRKKRGRETTDDITIAMNLGIALEDMATAILVYESALKLKIGTRLPA
ncbi:MAG: ornithine cyclodeaminase family protein [Opitutaceae bacterium]|nr:ornithine cyclodeaminase family protein [Opitutaceae bacterium]NBR58522.1 ornithine cyclodeaminase family protein [Opitutaceae bacterium]